MYILQDKKYYKYAKYINNEYKNNKSENLMKENVSLVFVRNKSDFDIIPLEDILSNIFNSLKVKFEIKKDIKKRLSYILKSRKNVVVVEYPDNIDRRDNPEYYIYDYIYSNLWANNIKSIKEVFILNEITEDRNFDILKYYIEKGLESNYYII